MSVCATAVARRSRCLAFVAALFIVPSTTIGSVRGQAPAEPPGREPLPLASSQTEASPAQSASTDRVISLSVSASGPSHALLVEVARADLELVSDVRLVAHGAEAELTIVVQDGGARVELARGRSSASTPDDEIARAPIAIAAFTSAELGDRSSGHVLADSVLEALTGRRGAFDSALAFTQLGRDRRKAVMVAGVDGQGAQRVSSEGASALLPAFAHGDIWYSVLDDGSLYVTRVAAGGRPTLEGGGLTMGVQPCGERVVFSSNRDGDSEIYSALPDGSDVTRLTFHAGIDVSPTCAPDGTLAFVSSRTGTPQIHVLEPGASEPRRIPQPAGANQTPVFCPDAERNLIAFTQMGRGMRVAVIDLASGATRVVSPRGAFKDPAFSPDCRLIAMAGPGGLFVSSLDGTRHRRVLQGRIESVRWGPRRAP